MKDTVQAALNKLSLSAVQAPAAPPAGPNANPAAELSTMKLYVKRMDQVKQGLAACSQIDICFCCDITGSMQEYIDTVKETLVELAVKLRSELNIVPRFAFLGYRDKEDAKQFERVDFTRSTEEIVTFIKNVKCNGGGDACEDAVGALFEAGKLSWQSREKFLIWILDAPTHGQSYHGTELDDHPGDDKQELNLELVSRFFSATRIGLVVFKCDASTDMMLRIFAENYNNKRVKLEDFTFSLQEAKKMGMPALQKQFLIKCSSSISSIHSSAALRNDSIREPDRSEVESRWNDMITHKMFDFVLWSGEPKRISFEDARPIIEIDVRRVANSKYHLGLTKVSSGAFRNCYQLYDESGKYIAKIPKVRGGAADLVNLSNEPRLSVLSSYFADRFNEETKMKRVNFLPSMLFEAHLDDLRSNHIFNNNKYIIGEKFMEGKYQKFNSNSGWVNPNTRSSDLCKFLQAFSHFTFHKSKGSVLVVDLQGTFTKDAIYLTDPAIHSNTEYYSFGKTDRKQLGVAEFFRSHECNKFCTMLCLAEIKMSPSSIASLEDGSPRASSTLSVQLPKFEARSKDALAVGHGEKSTVPADLLIVIYGIETLESDKVNGWLSKFCNYISMEVIMKRIPKKCAKLWVWLKYPALAQWLVDRYDMNRFEEHTVKWFVPDKERPFFKGMRPAFAGPASVGAPAPQYKPVNMLEYDPILAPASQSDIVYHAPPIRRGNFPPMRRAGGFYRARLNYVPVRKPQTTECEEAKVDLAGHHIFIGLLCAIVPGRDAIAKWLSTKCEYTKFECKMDEFKGRPRVLIFVWVRYPSQAREIVEKNRVGLFEQGICAKFFMGGEKDWKAPKPIYQFQPRPATYSYTYLPTPTPTPPPPAASAQIAPSPAPLPPTVPQLRAILNCDVPPRDFVAEWLKGICACAKFEIYSGEAHKGIPTTGVLIWLNNPAEAGKALNDHKYSTFDTGKGVVKAKLASYDVVPAAAAAAVPAAADTAPAVGVGQEMGGVTQPYRK